MRVLGGLQVSPSFFKNNPLHSGLLSVSLFDTLILNSPTLYSCVFNHDGVNFVLGPFIFPPFSLRFRVVSAVLHVTRPPGRSGQLVRQLVSSVQFGARNLFSVP